MELATPTAARNDRGKRNSREVANSASELPKAAKHEVDPDHILGIVGIVGTFLNLMVVVLVYVYTPI